MIPTAVQLRPTPRPAGPAQSLSPPICTGTSSRPRFIPSVCFSPDLRMACRPSGDHPLSIVLLCCLLALPCLSSYTTPRRPPLRGGRLWVRLSPLLAIFLPSSKHDAGLLKTVFDCHPYPIPEMWSTSCRRPCSLHFGDLALPTTACLAIFPPPRYSPLILPLLPSPANVRVVAVRLNPWQPPCLCASSKPMVHETTGRRPDRHLGLVHFVRRSYPKWRCIRRPDEMAMISGPRLVCIKVEEVLLPSTVSFLLFTFILQQSLTFFRAFIPFVPFLCKPLASLTEDASASCYPPFVRDLQPKKETASRDQLILATLCLCKSTVSTNIPA